MQGLIFTIDKLGESLAAAENRIAHLEAENAALRQQISGSGEPPAGQPATAPQDPAPVAPAAAAQP